MDAALKITRETAPPTPENTIEDGAICYLNNIRNKVRDKLDVLNQILTISEKNLDTTPLSEKLEYATHPVECWEVEAEILAILGLSLPH
jgi:hypothetical protein